MNLLWVIHHPVFGGPHNKALRLAPYLRSHDWQGTVLLPAEAGNAWQRLQAGGIPVVRTELSRVRRTFINPATLAGYALRLSGDIERIRSVIERQGIDLVVVTGLANPQAALAAAQSGVPLVWQVLDTRMPPVARRLMMLLVNSLADSVMFNGASLIEVHRAGAELEKRSYVYYPPVDTGQFLPSTARRAAARRRLGIPADAVVIGMVANLNPQKGIEQFIRAAAIIRRSRDDVFFLMIGARYSTQRRYTKRLISEIRASRIQDRLVFAGDVSDVENYYPAMDIKMITSVPRSEGTTTTALEALACGVPVIATRVGAVTDVVEHGVTGLVVPPLDPDALAEAATRLIADPALRQTLGSNGRQRAITRFDVEHCGETHLRAFEAAVVRQAQYQSARLPIQV